MFLVVVKYTNSKNPILDFFITRYDEAYKKQLENFLDCVINNKPTSVNFEDGRSALIIANAAYESMEYKKSIKINYDK